MLARLGWFTARRRWWVLAASVVIFAVAGTLGGGVAGQLSSGGFEDADAESVAAARVLDEAFGAGQPNMVLLVTAEQGDVDDPVVVASGTELTRELAAMPGIESAQSYWTMGSAPPLASEDRTEALVVAHIGGDEDAVDARIEELSPRFTRQGEVVSVAVGGMAEVFRQVGTTIERDLARAESVAIPITLVLLVVVFASVVAAVLPVAIGILAILGTFFVLWALSSVTQVSIYALNLTTLMGLALAIDYSLFVVSRYREELGRGLQPHDAVVRTVQTAGRTVLFSAATVAASLVVLLVFPLAFLRSFAYAGVSVVAVAAAASVVVLPAALAALGERIDRGALGRRRAPAVGDGFWHGTAMAVMRRPWPVAISVVAVLVALGLPFLHLELGLADDRTLPASASSRAVQDQIRQNFDSDEAGAAQVVATGIGDPSARHGEIGRYAAELSRLPRVARVDALTGTYVAGRQVAPPGPASPRFAAPEATWLSVVPSVEPNSEDGERLVRDIRALDGPFEMQVAGPSAQLVDSKASLLGRLPLAVGLIALITFTLLFLMFGSVVVPVKAVVLNLLSLSATFGAMVWVFQDGHLAGLLGFTPTGVIDTTVPILMFCIAFGLSMDYEVFLLSRVAEEHRRTGDNQRSVAVGLERTGRIVTAAAGLLAVVFIAMATSQVSFMKLFGVGITLAVLMDATLVRCLLVPAFMRLAGDLNWWAPAPLRRIHQRWGLSEAGGASDEDADPPERSEHVLEGV